MSHHQVAERLNDLQIKRVTTNNLKMDYAAVDSQQGRVIQPEAGWGSSQFLALDRGDMFF
jgi:hypothetical protein